MITLDNDPAEAIYVYGMNGPDGGSAMVLLDGQMTQTLNLTVSIIHHKRFEMLITLCRPLGELTIRSSTSVAGSMRPRHTASDSLIQPLVDSS